MFDLFRSRDKAVRILLGALLLVVAFSMLTYLVPNYSSGNDPTDQVVAEVGKTTVTLPDVQRAIQNVMRGQQIPQALLPTYIPQIVESLITEKALEFEADRQGFQVTEADVADQIRTMVPSLFPDGKFVGKDAYAAMLAQQNTTIAEFEQDLKRQLLVTRLRNVAMEATVVTPAEVEQEFRRRNEKIKIEYVKLAPDKYKNEVTPTPEEIQAYYKANGSSFTFPEKKNLAILMADQGKLEQTINPAEGEIQAAYNQNKDAFRTVERVKVRHILLKTTDKPAAEEAQIKTKAEGLLKQIRGGANFAELAKKNSDDTGSATNGGDLPDWVTRGQTVPEFERAAFTLPVGQTSDLVKTQYGYHIIQVQQHEQARLRPYEEVKAELAGQLKKQRVSDLMQQVSDRAQAALQKDPTHPEKVAADLNVQLVRADGVAPGVTIPEIGTSKDFDESIASLKQGEVSQAVALPSNRVVVSVVTGITPARPATLDEAKDRIRDTISRGRLDQAVRKHAQELADQAKSMGGDLKKAAQAMGLTVKTSDEFTRLGAVEGLGSADYVQEGFTKPDGTVFGPSSMSDGMVVCKVLSHVAADPAQLPAQRAAVRDEIKSRKARDRNTLFEAGVRDALVKDKKIKVHQDVLNRLITNYRPS